MKLDRNLIAIVLIICQILACKSKTISIQVTHEETFVVQGGDDQDVVEMEDPKLTSFEEKSEFQYLTSLKHSESRKASKKSYRDNQESSQIWHETKQNSVKEVNQERNGQSDTLNQGPVTKIITLKTSDGLAEQRRISLENMSNSYRDKKIKSEIKSKFKPSTPKQMDGNWEPIIMNNSGRKEAQDYYRSTFGSNSSPNDIDLQGKLQDIENNDSKIDHQTSRSSSRNFSEDKREKQHMFNRSPRLKRQLDINAIADAHFENSSSSRSNDSIQMVTAEDRKVEERAAAQRADLLRYLGGVKRKWIWSLLSKKT
ncbi:uncharacterized protein LOC125662126 isoform X2 [Ostrea edulis]|uniref:uncharacterized protein LOC125662126 isoform X2 n=1 Tax=Ostrea edulis TaxID=37623 RepID=UPI0024AF8C95|nr:uncharacterized protein LOC125662126 isoform X2 [Ostrea edulis]